MHIPDELHTQLCQQLRKYGSCLAFSVSVVHQVALKVIIVHHCCCCYIVVWTHPLELDWFIFIVKYNIVLGVDDPYPSMHLSILTFTSAGRSTYTPGAEYQPRPDKHCRTHTEGRGGRDAVLSDSSEALRSLRLSSHRLYLIWAEG